MDERQQAIRAKGWKIATIEILAVILLQAITDAFGRPLFATTGVLLVGAMTVPTLTLIPYFILKGAYLMPGEAKHGMRTAGFWFVLAIIKAYAVVQRLGQDGAAYFINKQQLQLGSIDLAITLIFCLMAVTLIIYQLRENAAERD